MDLRSSYDEAVKKAISRFFSAKTDEPVYIFGATVAGRKLFAILTAQECRDAKIKTERNIGAADGKYGLTEHKHQIQEIRNDPKRRATIQYLRGVRQQVRAREKPEKMERGEKSPARPSQLPTTEA